MRKQAFSDQRSAVSLTACERLALAQQQLLLMMSGRAVRVVDTPQLGRTEFASVSITDLSRLVEQLKRECDAEQGIIRAGRHPISVEGCP